MQINIESELVVNELYDLKLAKNNIDLVSYDRELFDLETYKNDNWDLKLYNKNKWDFDLYINYNSSSFDYILSPEENLSICNIYSRANLSEIDEYIEDIDCFFDDFL